MIGADVRLACRDGSRFHGQSFPDTSVGETPTDEFGADEQEDLPCTRLLARFELRLPIRSAGAALCAARTSPARRGDAGSAYPSPVPGTYPPSSGSAPVDRRSPGPCTPRLSASRPHAHVRTGS